MRDHCLRNDIISDLLYINRNRIDCSRYIIRRQLLLVCSSSAILETNEELTETKRRYFAAIPRIYGAHKCQTVRVHGIVMTVQYEFIRHLPPCRREFRRATVFVGDAVNIYRLSLCATSCLTKINYSSRHRCTKHPRTPLFITAR